MKGEMTMNGTKLSYVFKKATFPAILTILSFLLFLLMCFLLTVGSVDPHYLKGLLFAVPFLCFGSITWLTEKGRLKIASSSIITGVLIIVLGTAILRRVTRIGKNMLDLVVIRPSDHKVAGEL
jgi:hypothetical protein